MKSKVFAIVSVLLFILAATAVAQTKTTVKDARSKRMLLGKHLVSLQWISWDHFGKAAVTERKRVLYLKGEQKGRESSDFVKIDGRITSVDKNEFKFVGTIVTQVSHIYGGKPCKREGEMMFRITGKRKYWRLQQIDNPCDAVADYVDIYFR